jgi:HlyD family secretion protein
MINCIKACILSILVFALSCSNSNSNKLNFTGIIEGTSIKIPALTGGEVTSLFVEEGIVVQKGQLIAAIDTLDLSFQRQQLEGGLDEISLQREIAVTNLRRAKNDYDYVQEKYQRFENLLETESVSQQIVDDVKNQLQNAESAYLTARMQYQTLETKKKQLEAQYQSVLKKIKDAIITAPQAGVISEKYYEQGEAIPSMTPIVELIHIEEVWVKIYISETLLPHIKIGQTAEIKPDGLEEGIPGLISWVSSKAEFTPKTILTEETRLSLVYAVKILIKNPHGILKHGMPVAIQLEQVKDEYVNH